MVKELPSTEQRGLFHFGFEVDREPEDFYWETSNNKKSQVRIIPVQGKKEKFAKHFPWRQLGKNVRDFLFLKKLLLTSVEFFSGNNHLPKPGMPLVRYIARMTASMHLIGTDSRT